MLVYEAKQVVHFEASLSDGCQRVVRLLSVVSQLRSQRHKHQTVKSCYQLGATRDVVVQAERAEAEKRAAEEARLASEEAARLAYEEADRLETPFLTHMVDAFLTSI